MISAREEILPLTILAEGAILRGLVWGEGGGGGKYFGEKFQWAIFRVIIFQGAIFLVPNATSDTTQEQFRNILTLV